MNRSEAMTPLVNDEGRFTLTAGVFIRGNVRRAATIAVVDFYEEKGVLSSSFIFRGPRRRLLALRKYLVTTFQD